MGRAIEAETNIHLVRTAQTLHAGGDLLNPGDAACLRPMHLRVLESRRWKGRAPLFNQLSGGAPASDDPLGTWIEDAFSREEAH